jgi:pilus assembly protein Flp/PilA
MRGLIFRFLNDEVGATAVEYGLIASGISIAIIGMVRGIGSNPKVPFTTVNTGLK